jgi:hypothetical protein
MTSRLIAAAAVTMSVLATFHSTVVHAARQEETDRQKSGSAGTQMKLWKEIDISSHQGTFPCLGSLNNDGKVDFLLYRQGPRTTPGYLIALDHDGRKLWEMGDASIHDAADVVFNGRVINRQIVL